MRDEAIRLSSSAELGSLQDTAPPVKRLTPEQIRKLRLQAHKQQHFSFATLRAFITLWSDAVSAIALVFTRKGKTECQRNGHFISRNSLVPKCKFCGIKINSMSLEKLRWRG